MTRNIKDSYFNPYKKKRYRGSALVSVVTLALFLFFSFSLLLVDFYRTKIIYIQEKQYFIAKTMQELSAQYFFEQCFAENGETKGAIVFKQGEVIWEIKEDGNNPKIRIVEFRVQFNNKIYFGEKKTCELSK